MQATINIDKKTLDKISEITCLGALYDENGNPDEKELAFAIKMLAKMNSDSTAAAGEEDDFFTTFDKKKFVMENAGIIESLFFKTIKNEKGKLLKHLAQKFNEDFPDEFACFDMKYDCEKSEFYFVENRVINNDMLIKDFCNEYVGDKKTIVIDELEFEGGFFGVESCPITFGGYFKEVEYRYVVKLIPEVIKKYIYEKYEKEIAQKIYDMTRDKIQSYIDELYYEDNCRAKCYKEIYNITLADFRQLAEESSC